MRKIGNIRWLIVLLVIIVSLTGCNGEKETLTNDEDNKQISTKEEGNDTRKVKDAFGEVEIPVKPKRVAGIYLEDYMLALGVEPIVQWYHPSWGKQEYLGLTDVPLFDITGSLEAMLEKNLT